MKKASVITPTSESLHTKRQILRNHSVVSAIVWFDPLWLDQAAATTMLGMQPLVGLPFSDPVVQAMAAASGVDGLGGGVIEKAVGGLAGFRIGEGGNVLSAQEGLSLMLANIRGLAEHKVGTVPHSKIKILC